MRLPWGLRWWELAPEAVLAAVLALFLATETSAATSAFSSGKAVALMAATGVVWLLGRVLLVRFAPWPALRLGVFAAAAAGVAAVVVLPAYDDTTVVETLSASPATTATTAAAPPGGPAPAVTTTPVTTPAAPAPTSATTVASAGTVPPRAPATTAPPATAAPAPGPVALRSSALRGIDHRASGTAVLYRQPDGSYVVGLEGIDIQPGPDYDLYVVPGAGQERPGGGAGLGDLRGNKGTQYYPVPAGTDVGTGEWTVLVWCETFDVPIANASLA